MEDLTHQITAPNSEQKQQEPQGRTDRYTVEAGGFNSPLLAHDRSKDHIR